MHQLQLNHRAVNSKMNYETHWELFQISAIRYQEKYRVATAIVTVKPTIPNKHEFNQNREEHQEEIVDELVLETLQEKVREHCSLFKRSEYVMPISRKITKKGNDGSFRLRVLFQIDPSTTYYNKINGIQTLPIKIDVGTQTQETREENELIYEKLSEENKTKCQRYEKAIKKKLTTQYPNYQKLSSQDHTDFFYELSKFRQHCIDICTSTHKL